MVGGAELPLKSEVVVLTCVSDLEFVSMVTLDSGASDIDMGVGVVNAPRVR